MEIAYRLILYILMANVAYMMFSLARKDYKHHSAYISQLFFLLCVMIVLVARDVSGGLAVLISFAGMFLVVFLPMFLQRQIDMLLAENRIEQIEPLARWKASLAWSDENLHLHKIARIAKEFVDDPATLEKEIRNLLNRGEPFDSMTRVFIGLLHFNQRNFEGMIRDLAVEAQPWNEYSFEELLYLVRAYLETTRYEEAAQAQLALERKMINFEEFSFEKMGNLAISRMIFFAFLGWKEEFEELQQQKEEGIERLPAEIRDFWHGVCVFNSGDFTQGEELMGKAMRSCDKNEEAESWLPFMRKRFFGLQEQKEFLSSRLLVKLKDIKQLYAPKFHEIFIESRQSSSDTERSETCTNILAWLTMIISVALMYSVGIDDLVSLIRIGANSSVLVQQGDYFRLFTSLFIHIGWVHLFMNVIALKFFGPPVESIAGWQGFLGIYFFSGLIGGLSGVLFGQSLSAGASAAVLGLLSVSIIFEIFRVRGIEKVSSKNTFSTLVFILIINLVIGVVEPGVDNSAHMGGLAGGALIALFFVPFLKNGYLPRMIKILSVIFVMVFSLGSITQVLMKSEHDFYPANTVNFKTVANASGTLSLQIPELWDLDESLTSFRELTAQGPFRERLVIMLSVNDADENTVIQEHINARTREIENTKNLNLKIRKGPDKIDFLKKNIYEVRWLLESGESPVSVVDYLVFDNEMFYLIRFFLGTSQHEYYDNIMLKVLHSFSSPMFDLHEKSIEEQ